MKTVALVLLACSVGFAGCGGDDSSDTTKKGVFVDSPVAQLHYATATEAYRPRP